MLFRKIMYICIYKYKIGKTHKFMNVKLRLIIMNFLQFAVWGAYLTSMGSYLVSALSYEGYRLLL